MKRFLSIILPLALLIAACSKEKSLEVPGTSPTNPGGGPDTTGGGGADTTFYMTAKQDGVATSFNEELEAEVVDDTSGAKIYGFGGFKSTDPNDFEGLFITIIIAPGNSLTPGTYSVTDLTSGNILAAYYANSDGSKEYITITTDSSPDPFTVTITTITATEIKGTFKGRIFESPDGVTPNPTGPYITYTEGAFRAEIQ